MADFQDDGSFSISGAYGEVSLIDPRGEYPPRKLFELNGCQWSEERAVTDVPLPNNESGQKFGAVSRSGSLDVRYVDEYFYELVGRAIDLGDLDARRAARDAGTRLRTDVTLHVWLDDPDSLGRIGKELLGVRFPSRSDGFGITEPVIGRSYPFRLRKVRRLEGHVINGNQVDEVTGLPLVRKLAAGNA